MQTKYILTTLLLVLSSVTNVLSVSYIWIGNNSTNWNTTNNWSPAGIPVAADYITLNSNAPNNLVLDQNRTVANFTINGDTVDLGTYTLTTTGVTYFNGGKIVNGQLQPGGGLCHFGGTVFDVKIAASCTYFHMNGGVFLKPVVLVSSGTSNTTGTGNSIFEDSLTITHSGVFYFTMGSSINDFFNGPVTITNHASKEVYLANGDTSFYNANVTISSTGSGGVAFGNGGGVSVLASGKTITIGSSGFAADYLTLKNFIQNGTTAQTLTLTGTAIVNMTSCTFNGSLNVNAPGFLIKNCIFNGITSLSKTGTTNLHCYGGNTFNATTTIANNNASGRIRLATTTGDIYLGNVEFEGTTIQVAYEGMNDFYGNITHNGNVASDVVFDAGSGTCRLRGSSNQELTGNNHRYRKLIVAQGFSSSRDIVFWVDISIKDTLNLISGKLIAGPVTTLVMKAGSKVVGGSDSSFVSGPVNKIGNTEFEFPVGKGSVYRPLHISAPTTSTHAFTAAYFDQGQPVGENLDGSLAYIDDCNYWTLTRDVGNSQVFVTLSWQNGHCPVKDTTYLKIASWYSDNWNDKGHGTMTGNYTSGTITTTTTNSLFEYFTFAYDSNIVKVLQPDEYITADGFVANMGQLLGTDSLAHPEVLYYGSAFNSNFYLSDSVFTYVFMSSDSIYGIDSIAKHVVIDSLLRVDMRLKGINSAFEISATDTSQGYKNYFLGYLDTSYTHALTFQEIKYTEIYDGIDLLFHNNDEFRFSIDSSGLAGSIQLYYQGSDSVKIDGEGFLNIFSRLGNKKYGINGFEYVSDQWRGIDVSFQQTDSIISLALGAVTRNVPLIISIGPWQFPFPPAVINPHNKLKWCTSYGLSGFANDNFSDCHIDPADNVYVVGQTFNPNFPIFQNIQPYIGSADISVVKFLPGRNRAFSTTYGGSSVDFGIAIRIDYDGNILFTGSTISVDFPPCPTCLTPQSTLGGKLDAYVVKLTPNGQTQLLSTYYGLTENDFGYGIAVDKINNIYLVGGTAGGIPIPASQPANSFYSDFTANNNASTLFMQDGFVAKFTSSNVLEWATHYGSDGTNNPLITNEYIASIEFDEVGNNFYVMGVTNCDKVQVCAAPCSTDVSPDFPITGSNYIYDTPNVEDYFIVKFNSSLQVTWSTLWGGASSDAFIYSSQNRALAVSPYNDDLIITGHTSSTDLETMDMGGSSYFDGTPSAGFIASFDSNDNLKWSTYYKGETRSVSANTLGQFIVTGSTDNANLDLVQSNLGAYYQPEINNQIVNNGNFDGFYLKFNSGSILNHATYIGGAQNDYLMSSSIQKSNGSNSISVGFTSSSNFPWRDFIPNYIGDYSFGDPGLSTSSPGAATPFVFNLYNVSTPLRIASPDEFSEETVKPKSNCVIYPNPFTNVVHFKTTEILKEITIYDLAGQQLVRVDAPFNDYSTIDLTAYAPGIYMAEVVTIAKRERFKIIKITP